MSENYTTPKGHIIGPETQDLHTEGRFLSDADLIEGGAAHIDGHFSPTNEQIAEIHETALSELAQADKNATSQALETSRLIKDGAKVAGGRLHITDEQLEALAGSDRRTRLVPKLAAPVQIYTKLDAEADRDVEDIVAAEKNKLALAKSVAEVTEPYMITFDQYLPNPRLNARTAFMGKLKPAEKQQPTTWTEEADLPHAHLTYDFSMVHEPGDRKNEVKRVVMAIKTSNIEAYATYAYDKGQVVEATMGLTNALTDIVYDGLLGKGSGKTGAATALFFRHANNNIKDKKIIINLTPGSQSLKIVDSYNHGDSYNYNPSKNKFTVNASKNEMTVEQFMDVTKDILGLIPDGPNQ